MLGDLVSAFLFGIAPTDRFAFAGAIAALALVAATASIIPGWRASGMSATEVLGAE